MKQKNITRRKILTAAGLIGVAGSQLPSGWTKPLVNSVILPAHAQTSGCSAEDVAGNWAFSVPSDPAGGGTLYFKSDGTWEDEGTPGSWSVSGNTFTFERTYVVSGATHNFRGTATLSSDCTSMMSGSFTDEEVGGATEAGTFTATKI